MSFVYRPTLANLNLGAPLALVFSARNMLKKKNNKVYTVYTHIVCCNRSTA